MLSLFQKIMDRLRPPPVKTPEEELEDFLRKLRAASKEELGGVLAGALLAKKTLDTTRQVEVPFPSEVLDGHVPLDDAARAQLETYGNELKRFQQECFAAGTVMGASVGRGLETWIVTVRAVAMPALIGKAREVWWLLMQGEHGVEAAYRFMVRRDVSDAEITYLSYRPILLTPATA